MIEPVQLGPVFDIRPLMAAERRDLFDLLRGLSVEQWRHPTPCPGWNVHDLVCHLLGDDLGQLSRKRDRFAPLEPAPDEPLPDFINRLNAEWVRAAGRLSPRTLIDLLAWSGDQVIAYWNDADLDEPAEGVSWAGIDPAPTWLDAAREFTEWWVHRQQLLEALGHTDPPDAERLHAVLETFVRSLPHALAGTIRPLGGVLELTATGPGGDTWWLVSDGSRWTITTPASQAGTPPSQGAGSSTSSARVQLPANVLWRLGVRSVNPGEVRMAATVDGDEELTRAALRLVAIIRTID